MMTNYCEVQCGNCGTVLVKGVLIPYSPYTYLQQLECRINAVVSRQVYLHTVLYIHITHIRQIKQKDANQIIKDLKVHLFRYVTIILSIHQSVFPSLSIFSNQISGHLVLSKLSKQVLKVGIPTLTKCYSQIVRQVPM